MSDTMPAPFDVRLMNLTASLLFAACFVLVLSAVLWWAARHSAFSIRSIEVDGEIVHANAQTLRSNVAPKLNGNFFTVDLPATRMAFESVPWVRRAVVSREFPDRLRVSLREQQAVALWGNPNGSQMLNELGEVFEANVGEVDQDALPRLIGPDTQSAHLLDMFRALEPVLEPLDLGIEQLELTGRGDWRVRLDSEGQIELGTGTIADVLERTSRFVRTAENVTKQQGREPDAIESADLRYADGYALRLRGVTTGVDAGKTTNRKNNSKKKR
ncbi:MAG: cell division protein FtsQ/DivIB [Burkholderiales bacterium]